MSADTSIFEHMSDTGLPDRAAAAAAAADEIAGLGPAATLDRLTANRAAREAAEIDDLQCALHWAVLHGALETAGSPALPGAERLVPLGGDGTPFVAEFAPAELGAEIGASPHAAAALIGDALDLAHRLPRLWAAVRTGQARPWIARKVAQAARPLAADAAAAVDARVAPWAGRLTWARLEPVVEAAVLAADPARAEALAAVAETTEGVWVDDPEDGLADIRIRTDAASATEFDHAIDHIATGLADLGDTDPRNVRRAKAVGVLAHPQQALDLISGADAEPALDPDTAPHNPRKTSRTPGPRQAATLHVHISADAWQTGCGFARAEGIGPITLGQARRWLRNRDVVVRPVIDPADTAPVDAYEATGRLREAVRVLMPADTFPYASSTGRSLDLDHTQPYRPPDHGGPPGQTRIGNLAPLTRRHHRIKTHSRWQVQQPYPGVLIWKSPHGRLYLVDNTGTRRL
jgi:Domain of unknown function (DUF222)